MPPRRRKPLGWPDYLEAKPLRSGGVAHYWNPPSWARKAGCPVRAEALGKDYAAAKKRCDDILNPQFDAWRLGRDGAVARPAGPAQGTFDWLIASFKSHPAYNGRPAKTKKSYDSAAALIANHRIKDGRRFGELSISGITPGVADRLFAKLRVVSEPAKGEDGKPLIGEDGGPVMVERERQRTAVLCMTVARRAWFIVRRDKPAIVPDANPFAKMGLSHKAKATRPVSADLLGKFVEAADAGGEASIGTACMIAYYWLQRQEDILTRLSWSHYRPADNPSIVRVKHHKTGEVVDIPLYDEDGTELWPELMSRLDAAPRHGTLIVTRDQPDRHKKVRLPWGQDYFRHRVAAIRKTAGIPEDAKFMGLRHGGNVEGAEADLTDAQLRGLSGHKTTAALLRYVPTTAKQRQAGARKRLEARTKAGGLSE
ncbi:hypothetical protein [Bosea rubneri]|uniref:Phage integrase family protein n=1 Tax=Bosea rubneri TaxID=3075434 RepID=A0ABU3S5A8_9HYPH|nr:hypothetical protein [Bosea sp. ZW T0_25]MDU0339555.1 hypothetical protein [Bosea sp. ZW T0_25]